MTPKSVGFKLGLIVAILHLLLVLLTYAAVAHSTSSTAGLAFLPFMFLDAPILFLGGFLPGGDALMRQPLIVFGVAGSFLWFAIPWLADRLVARIFPNTRRWVRWLAALAALPALIYTFVPLSHVSVSRSIRAERPEEIQVLLKHPAPGALARRTVWNTNGLDRICGIHPDPDAGGLLLTCHRSVLRLDAQFAVQHRLDFPEYYQSVAPVQAGGAFTGQYIVHRLFEHAALLGPDGRELWRAGGQDVSQLGVEGVRAGDIDGDGRPEFAVFHSYTDGIELLDEAGQIRWKHPVDSLDHLEMADVRGNGKQEILFRDSPSGFKVLDAQGQVAAELDIATDSSKFALVAWPAPAGRPNLVLTEENQIRIVDLDGHEIRRLEAPGCRGYGDLAAVPVRFRAGAPAFLAVRKDLHPDLAVLYVFDSEGRRVHQDVEVVLGSADPALAAVPAGASGAEHLLVGSGENNQVRLL